jgi:hypothetical protein
MSNFLVHGRIVTKIITDKFSAVSLGDYDGHL